MPGVAIIGWGSLVHHPEGDAIRGQKPLATIGEWQRTGPTLPLEFSRISVGRHLTLVIDPVAGRANTTFVIRSQFDLLNEAANNLRAREGTPDRKIGRMPRGGPVPPEGPVRVIHSWLEGTDFEAVVWTALEPKFLPDHPYSAAAGDAYLGTLQGEDRRRAYRYIAEAPDEIVTSLREIARWPEAVAAHEAGHFVIACALDRGVVRLSRIPVDDRPGNLPTIGCHHVSLDLPGLELVACDLAGAWAQVLHFPESIARRKMQLLKQNILLPPQQHPHYSWLGWTEDLTPVFQNLRMPPALAEFQGLPRTDQIEPLNQRLRTFFLREDVGQSVKLVADALLAAPVIRDPELANLRAGVNAVVSPRAARQMLFDGI